MNYASIILIFIPLIIGFVFPLCFRKPEQTNLSEDLKIAPPSKFFGVIWGLIYFILGLALFEQFNSVQKSYKVYSSICFAALIFSLNSWIYIRIGGNNVVLSAFSLAISIAFSILCSTISANKSIKLKLVPLIAWGIFALILNCIQGQILMGTEIKEINISSTILIAKLVVLFLLVIFSGFIDFKQKVSFSLRDLFNKSQT